MIKEARAGKGTITLRELAEILKEVLEPEEIEIIISHLKSKRKV